MSLKIWREDYLYFCEVFIGEKPFKACAFDRKGAWQKLKIKLGINEAAR